jgi:hypothetical protein
MIAAWAPNALDRRHPIYFRLHRRVNLLRYLVTPAPAKTSSSRNVLPADLPNAIKQLDDQEFDRLLAAVLAEQKRRGKRLPVPERKQRGDVAPTSLTRGQFNAVRAAFKAGVTPSRIARQFGLSQTDVRKALASDESKR